MCVITSEPSRRVQTKTSQKSILTWGSRGQDDGSPFRANVCRFLVLPICFFLGGMHCMEHLLAAQGPATIHSSCSPDYGSTERYLTSLVRSRTQDAEKNVAIPKEGQETRLSRISMDDLVNTQSEIECADDFILVEDQLPHFNPTGNFTEARKQSRIPWVIHMTSKSRCVRPTFERHINDWKALNEVEFRLHNDAAMNRLILDKDWSEFPLLRHAVKCMNNMVERADLWRALIIYEYGGIYTDMDNGPGRFHPSAMDTEADAYFEQEREGFLSQYFFAASPRHPILFYLVQNICSRVLNLPDYHHQYAPMITGPGAMKSAGMYFMGTQFFKRVSDGMQDFSKPQPGKYLGMNVTGEEWALSVVPYATIDRSVAKRKGSEFQKMNMTGYEGNDRPKSNVSCHHILYEDLLMSLRKDL